MSSTRFGEFVNVGVPVLMVMMSPYSAQGEGNTSATLYNLHKQYYKILTKAYLVGNGESPPFNMKSQKSVETPSTRDDVEFPKRKSTFGALLVPSSHDHRHPCVSPRTSAPFMVSLDVSFTMPSSTVTTRRGCHQDYCCSNVPHHLCHCRVHIHSLLVEQLP